jgi:alpha-L-rhamnosidase
MLLIVEHHRQKSLLRRLSAVAALACGVALLTPTPAGATRIEAAPAQTAPTVIHQSSTAAPVPLTGANWIWSAENTPLAKTPAGTRYLRRTFTVPTGTVTGAQFVVTGDDSVDVWLNGVKLAGSARGPQAWRQAGYVDLTSAVHTGTNTLAVAARNTETGSAGVLGRVRVTTTTGQTDLVTDSTWLTAKTVAAQWTEPRFDDSAWSAAATLGRYGAKPWGILIAPPNVFAPSPLTVSATTTERLSTPLGIDAAQPRFGWQLSASGKTGLIQGGYRIVVASTKAKAAAGTGDVWDSGRVASGQSVDAVYAGPALTSSTRYYWRVQTWDTQGRAGIPGAVSWFETGLLHPATEWKGKFIGASTDGPTLTGANWVWFDEGDPASSAPAATRYFRRDFTLPTGTVTSATLTATGDDTADVWVNGTQVSTSPRAADSWKTAAVVEIGSLLHAGPNTIAIASTNTSAGPAGLIASVQVDVAGSDPVRIVTDATWVASTEGPSGWTEPAFDDSTWTPAKALGQYGIGPWDSNVSISRGAPYLRKGFTLAKKPTSARLTVTALGLHETHINGERVGAEALAPGWTDYNKRLQYRTFDVTSLLHTGANAIGSLIGNGWYSGSLGFAGSQKYGTQPYYGAQLVVRFADGTSTTVATDDTWRTAPSPIRADDLYHGEDYDARAVQTGWDQAGFADSTWKSASVRDGATPNLVAAVDPGVKVQSTLRPKAITEPKPGVWVVDLGQNHSGWDRLKVRGATGTTVTLRHAEILNDDGTIYTANLRAARQTDRFTLAGTGADEVYEPRFTVHGYRYVEITGFPGTPTADSLTGLVAWTDGAGTGTFTSSDPLLNDVQRNIVWGERSNMLSLPTDCPQRDERLGWTGDIAAFAATGTFNVDIHGLLDKFTDDLVDAQQPNGAFTDVAPFVTSGSGTAGWGDAGVIVPYTVWQRYGDVQVIDEHFDAMKRWVDFSKATSGSDLIRNQWTYGDWLNVQDETAQDLISTAYFGYTARLVSRMAAATGRTADAATYGTLADQVAAAFTQKFVAADGTVSGGTQTGYVLALSFGMLPPDRVQASADKLAGAVAARDGHLSVGFLGVENLLPVLADHGHLDTAYQVLLQPGYPGWGYMTSKGATTIWERWDGIRTDGSLQDPGMNSFNHYGLGSVGDWLYRSVGGLGPDVTDPGYHRMVIAPKPGGGLTSGTSDLKTAYGRALSDWSISSGRLKLKVEIPANSTATIRVPVGSAAAAGSVTAPAQAVPLGYDNGAAVFALASGSYTFTAPA